MKGSKKILAALLAVILVFAVPITGKAATGEPIPAITLSTGKDQLTVSYNAGERKELAIQVSNDGGMDAKNVVITPKIENQESWPFEIQRQDNYETCLGTIKAQSTALAKFDLTALQNVSTGRYKLEFDITYDDGTLSYSITKYLYVNTVEKTKAAPEPVPDSVVNEGPAMDSGEISGGAVESGGASASTSVPRVIVSGFTIDPGSIQAGSNFKLIVHLQNTSKNTAVRNMLFDFSAPVAGADAAVTAPAFLPISGSSSVYLDMIPASGTKDIAIDLNSRADLVQKPYEIAMSMKYEDGSGTQYDGTSTLAIPVKQPARFEFSEFEISSETVEVGADINVMCNLYNLGRVKLYNVKAKFQGEGIKSQDVYVGNVESGATASIDAMVTGEKETTGDGKTKMIVTYEDEAGTVFTVEKELVLMVTPAVDKVQEGMAVEDTQNKLPIVPILVVILAIAAITVTIVIVRRAKKKKLVQEEEKLADELDRLIEDE